MKGKAILGSLLMGLALPSYAVANISLPTSLSHQNNDKLIGTVEVAQRYLNFSQIGQRLYNFQSQILGIAYQYSGDRVRWDYVSVEYLNSQQMKLNLHGKISKIGRDAGLRVGLYLQPNYQNNFRVIAYDWETGKHCPSWCRNEVAKKLVNLPSEYPRFEAYLRSIL